MPIASNVTLSDALLVTAFCIPMAAAMIGLYRFRKPLLCTAETKWVAPIVCVLACAITIIAWTLYALSVPRQGP